jgi:hypothetical protein
MRALLFSLLLLTSPSCGDEEKGGSGETCETNADCSSGTCTTDADGNKVCASNPEPGGW